MLDNSIQGSDFNSVLTMKTFIIYKYFSLNRPNFVDFMRKPLSVDALETLGRVRLSHSFYMREFLYSQTANFHGLQNIPDNPDLAIEVE